MILSNVELHRALDEHRLVIRPEPTPRFPNPSQKCPYNTHSVDLTLAETISVPQSGPFVFDPRHTEGLANFQRQNSQQIILSESQPYPLERFKFVLGNTREYIHLPIPDFGELCLGARIEGRSSMARQGLLVHFTAPTVHPGFKGTLTLEMINLGPVPILLCAGMSIAQLIVEEVKGLPISNPSQFQGQTAPEGVIQVTNKRTT